MSFWDKLVQNYHSVFGGDRSSTVGWDGKNDPLHGRAFIDPKSGRLLLGADKKLYTPLASGGVIRENVTAAVEVLEAYLKDRDTTRYDALGTDQDGKGEWKVFLTKITCAGGVAANQELVPALAGKKIEATICGLHIGTMVNSSTARAMVCIFQDEDDTAVAPADCGITSGYYLYDSSTPRYDLANTSKEWPVFTFKMVTPTANKALEVDVSGLSGTEVCRLWGFFRYV